MSTLQGLTKDHWKQLDDILIIANEEQRLVMFKKIVQKMNENNSNLYIRLLEECKIAKVN